MCLHFPAPASLLVAPSLCHAGLVALLHPCVMQALGVQCSVNPEPGMDAITWMGITVWRAANHVHLGPLAFVLFTGVSILPAEVVSMQGPKLT